MLNDALIPSIELLATGRNRQSRVSPTMINRLRMSVTALKLCRRSDVSIALLSLMLVLSDGAFESRVSTGAYQQLLGTRLWPGKRVDLPCDRAGR